jgi:hypothetical protein
MIKIKIQVETHFTTNLRREKGVVNLIFYQCTFYLWILVPLNEKNVAFHFSFLFSCKEEAEHPHQTWVPTLKIRQMKTRPGFAPGPSLFRMLLGLTLDGVQVPNS